MKKLSEGTEILFARLILCGFVSGGLYIFMHELGHGIAALGAGAKITSFSLIHGYVATEGGAHGTFARQFFFAAGAIFPALSAAVYALLYRRGEGAVFRIFSFLYEAVCVFSLLDWIVTPVLVLLRCAPAGDDCTLFLERYPYHPLTLSCFGLAAAAALVVLAFRRGIPSDFMETVQNHLDNRL